jgi:hypothetical protein
MVLNIEEAMKVVGLDTTDLHTQSVVAVAVVVAVVAAAAAAVGNVGMSLV